MAEADGREKGGPGWPTPAPGERRRIAVLLGDEAAPVVAGNAMAEALAAHDARFLEERVVTARRVAATAWRRWRRRGLLSLLGVGRYYAHKMLRARAAPAKSYRPEFTTRAFGRDPAVRRWLDDFAPDVVVIGFCGVLPADFVQRAAWPIINMHPGVNPRYRGFGNYWAFAEDNFDLAGYTIHRVDEGIDTGERLAVARVDFSGVPFATQELHVAALAARHAASLIAGQAAPEVPEEFRDLPSAFYGLPTWADYVRAREHYRQRYDAPSAATTT